MSNKTYKWLGTIFVLTGILFTNLNFYSFNIFIHFIGVILWSVYGFKINDKAIITNFGLQIPLFLIGYLKLFNFF